MDTRCPDCSQLTHTASSGPKSWEASYILPYLPTRPPAQFSPQFSLHALATLPCVMWGAGPV